MIEQSVSLASNGVVKVPGYEQMARFGYTKNRGVYRLAVTASGEWEGLAIRAFWHTSDGKDPPASLVVDGYVDVPASVTAQPGNGCITFEGSDGTKTVTSADLRYRVSANSGTEDGTEPEPGTPAWQQLVDAVHTDATAAEQAKTDAQTAAQQAGASAGEAAASAKNAGQSATEALAWADAAEKSALAAGSNSQNAAQYAGEAKSFAEQAADSSSAAESSASAASGSQQAAESSAKKSDVSANTAQKSATLATGSASKAAQAQKNAETAANRAETAQQKTEEVRTDALDKISAAKADALKAVDAKQADATAAVERTTKKVLDAVTAAQGTAVKAVSDAQSTATQAVQTVQTDAVSAVKKAGSEVLESIPEDYQTTVEKVEELKTEKAEIDDTTVGLDAWSSKHIVDMLCPPISETGNPVVCYPVSGYPLGCKASWEPTQEGSGEPSPDNVRPIKGRDSVTVERCGENLLYVARIFPDKETYGAITFTNNKDGTITVDGITTKTLYFNSVNTLFLPAGTYTICAMANVRMSVLRESDRTVLAASQVGKFRTFTLAKNEVCHCFIACNGTFSNEVIRPCIVQGVVDTGWTQFHGDIYDLTLPRTIYGGTVDAVTSDGQETWKLLTFDGTEEWFDDGDYVYISKNEYILADVNVPAYSNQYLYHPKYSTQEDQTYMTASGARYLEFGPVDSVSAWIDHLVAQKAKGTPVQAVIAPKTPTSFTATGAQPIPALSGVNTVMTDADSATVTGRADPIKRITDLEDAVASMTNT